MEKKNALAKEERTIFIVLAIIIMIAIGVLVTWYFTKDKKEVENKDTKTKTEEKQKKKNTTSDTENYTLLPKTEEVKVLSSNVKTSKEVKVIAVADTNENNNSVISHNSKYIYLTNEKINFANFKSYTLEGEEVIFTNAIVKNVRGYNYDINANYLDVTGKYNIISNSIVTFSEVGEYVITLLNSDGREYNIIISVTNIAELNNYFNDFGSWMEGILEVEDCKYFNQDIYNDYITTLADYKNISADNIFLRREVFFQLEEKFYKLLDSKDYDAEKADKLLELENKINEITTNYLEENYTTESYANLAELLRNAQAILSGSEESSVYTINSLINNLKNAVDNLEEKETDVPDVDLGNNEYTLAIKALKDLLVTETNYDVNNYTAESYQTLVTAFNNAKAVDLDNATVDTISLDDISLLKEAIENAITNLVEKEIPETPETPDLSDDNTGVMI